MPVPIPRADKPHRRVETRGQRRRARQQNIPVVGITGKPESVPETAVQHQPNVVMLGYIFFALNPARIVPGKVKHLGVTTVFVQIPKYAREVATAPPPRTR